MKSYCPTQLTFRNIKSTHIIQTHFVLQTGATESPLQTETLSA